MSESIWALLSSIATDSWVGQALGGILAAAAGAIFLWLVRKSSPFVYGTDEYQERVVAQRLLDTSAKHDNEVVCAREINGTQLKLFCGDITRSTSQIVVSSDDTLLSATGGVARSIVAAAGKSVQKRLRALSATNLSRGSIAVTDGGKTHFRYIFHAVVLTKARDHTEYPSRQEIEKLLLRVLDVADATGTESISLPVLAGGTAAKKLRQEGLTTDQDVIRFVLDTLTSALASKRRQLKTVFLVAFDSRNLTADFVDSINRPTMA